LFLTDREDEYGFIDAILGKSRTKIPTQQRFGNNQFVTGAAIHGILRQSTACYGNLRLRTAFISGI
jgi:hypothetical protein